MAKVIKAGKRFKVVNAVNKIPVGSPNTFSTRAAAQKRARAVKCKVTGKSCPTKRRR
jgi:hypothetical protein